MLLQKEDPCLETHYSEAHEQASRPPFQELQFNDAQQAFQVRPHTSPFAKHHRVCSSGIVGKNSQVAHCPRRDSLHIGSWQSP